MKAIKILLFTNSLLFILFSQALYSQINVKTIQTKDQLSNIEETIIRISEGDSFSFDLEYGVLSTLDTWRLLGNKLYVSHYRIVSPGVNGKMAISYILDIYDISPKNVKLIKSSSIEIVNQRGDFHKIAVQNDSLCHYVNGTLNKSLHLEDSIEIQFLFTP